MLFSVVGVLLVPVVISPEATPDYHVVSRCVRKTVLFGKDKDTGRSFDHRRQWIADRIKELSALFAIDVCAFAVMSNHYHLVLHIDREQAQAWETLEVIRRWHLLFAGHHFTQRFLAGESLLPVERTVVSDLAELWRTRLMDISWFMRCLNEPIARDANKEDNCTGRFWEGRFKSQALLDEKALAACMAYVDLNPIRAGMAETPETSDHTSIQERIRAMLNSKGEDDLQPASLLPFVGNPREEMPKGLPFRLSDYLELVDWTGRQLRDDKRGAINANLPPILERLQVDPKVWLHMATSFESRFKGLVGAVYRLQAACKEFGYRRTPSLAACRELLA